MPGFLHAMKVSPYAACGLTAALATMGAATANAGEQPLTYDLAAIGGGAAVADPQSDDRGEPAPQAGEQRIETAEIATDDGEDDRKWSRDYFAVAAGVLSAPSYNGSDEQVILPGFYLRGRLSGFSFSTRGTNLQVDLIRKRRGENTDFKFGPLINLRGDRTARIKDAQVEALGERKLAAEIGFSTGITQSGVFTGDYDQLGFRLVGLHDVSGRHGSWVVSPTIEYATPLSKRIYVGASASVNFYGKGFGRYYYDIDAAGSAASGLPVYQAAGSRATLGKYTFGVAGAYALEDDLRKGLILIGGMQYGRIAGRYADSPIVRIAGDADQWIYGLGLAYNF